MSGTVFNMVNYTLASLLNAIELGQIGLPEIQRPFVWSNSKVRDLFDSLYRGYPVGYLLFWQTSAENVSRSIGTETKQLPPGLLVVDGQQRLTGLYAVTRSVEIIREDYQKEKIELSFSPLDGTFEVADAATKRDPRFIADISKLWAKGTSLFDVAAKYIDSLRAAREANGDELSSSDVKKVQSAIQTVANLPQYPFTALVLFPEINEEQVAEVFVRINSQGKALNQSDFILTLMSVFWEDGRADLEAFCRAAVDPSVKGANPRNAFIDPLPDQLLRVSVAVGFRRGRLRYVYSLLRGKDLETGVFSPTQREKQFDTLKVAQSQVLDLQAWHDFLAILPTAGIRSKEQISSQNALMMSYTLYLIGRNHYEASSFQLKRAIAQWFFMSSLTGRYTGGAVESAMERDLASLRNVGDATAFLDWIRANVELELTSDYWAITLPNRLKTSAARGPALFAYYASLAILGARVLFSEKKVSDVLAGQVKAKRSIAERHHLFPKGYLAKLGISSVQQINRIANIAIMEWDDNAAASDAAPTEYAPKFTSRFNGKELADMYYFHALPPNWPELNYEEFLAERERLMAKVIKDAFSALSGDSSSVVDESMSLSDLLIAGESGRLEYKSTLRRNLRTDEFDAKVEHSVLKTLAGFMNAKGGSLLIGVDDNGKVLGIAKDGFPNEDKMILYLTDRIRERLGKSNTLFVDSRFDGNDIGRVMVITVRPATKPVFLTDGNAHRFYVRTMASTTELMGSDAQHYIDSRF